MSSVAVTDSRWNGGSLLQSDVVFEFFSNVRIEVTFIDINFMSRVVILWGHSVEDFFNLTYTRAHIHASVVDWACYEG